MWLIHSLSPGPWGPGIRWLHCHRRCHCFLTSAALPLAPGKAFSFIFSTASPNILGGRDDPISQMWRLRCTGWEGFIQGSSNPWVQTWPQWSHNSVIFSVPWAPAQPLPPSCVLWGGRGSGNLRSSHLCACACLSAGCVCTLSVHTCACVRVHVYAHLCDRGRDGITPLSPEPTVNP